MAVSSNPSAPAKERPQRRLEARRLVEHDHVAAAVDPHQPVRKKLREIRAHIRELFGPAATAIEIAFISVPPRAGESRNRLGQAASTHTRATPCSS